MADFKDKQFVSLLIGYFVRTIIVTIVLSLLLVFLLSAIHRVAPDALRPISAILCVDGPVDRPVATSEPDRGAEALPAATVVESLPPAEIASAVSANEPEPVVAANSTPEKSETESAKESGGFLNTVFETASQAGSTVSDTIVGYLQEKTKDRTAATTNAPEATGTESGQTVLVVPEELPPDPRAATNEEPPHPWGLVVTNSYFYAADGTQKGILKGGTPIAYGDSKLHARGRMYSVQPLIDGVWQSTAVFLYEQDLILFPDVRYSESNREERDALIDFCIAYGRYEQERNNVIEGMKARRKNPFESEYRVVKADFDKLQTVINEKMALFRKTDMEIDDRALRNRLRQELEVLRGKQTDMKKRFDPISKKWNDWEEAHPASYSHIPENAKMQAQRQIMQRLSPVVENLVPGLTPTEMR